jgi:hypothetical protein
VQGVAQLLEDVAVRIGDQYGLALHQYCLCRL